MGKIAALKKHNLEIEAMVQNKYKDINVFLDTEVNKVLREILQLEDNTDITSIYFSPYSRTDKGITIKFDLAIINADSKDSTKYLFGHNMSVAYMWSPTKGSTIEMNHGSMGSFSDKDISRIDNIKNLYKVSQNLINIKFYLDTLSNIKITAKEIGELQSIKYANADKVRMLEAELKAHIRDTFVEENKGKEINVDFAIITRTYKKETPNKIQIVKKLPKGDYRVILYHTYPEQAFTAYINKYELDRIIKKLNKGGIK